MTEFVSLASENLLVALGISFAGGVMTSLTPCVYPVIMITVAVFGAREARSRLHAFSLSLAFAGALIIMYTSLGMVSGLTGAMFGKVYTAGWFIIAISVLFALMALSLFGLFTIEIPASLRGRFAGAGRAGYAGAFVMGLISGLLAAPCTGPVLVGILAFVSATRSVAVGASLLFAYSLGLSLIFIIVGTFVVSLPKSGKWLDAVKDAMGAGMLILAFYFLRFVLPVPRAVQEARLILIEAGAAAAAAGIFLLAASHTFLYGRIVGRNEGAATAKRRFIVQAFRVLSIILLAGGASGAVAAAAARPAGLDWIIDREGRAIELQAQDKKPMVIDFTALWCEACGEIDRKTFSDEKVSEELRRFVLLRMDLTDMDGEDEEIQKRYRVAGLPTVLVIDSRGKEAARITRFIGPQKFLEIIKGVF